MYQELQPYANSAFINWNPRCSAKISWCHLIFPEIKQEASFYSIHVFPVTLQYPLKRGIIDLVLIWAAVFNIT